MAPTGWLGQAYGRHVQRTAVPQPGRTAPAASARDGAGPSAALVALQRSAGNRATGSLLARKGTTTPGLAVHGGSKLDAAALLKLVTGNAKVPAWLRGSLAAKGGRIVEAKPL